jgi:hypothetical protein
MEIFMSMGRKILMALMPLLVVIGLQGMDHGQFLYGPGSAPGFSATAGVPRRATRSPAPIDINSLPRHLQPEYFRDEHGRIWARPDIMASRHTATTAAKTTTANTPITIATEKLAGQGNDFPDLCSRPISEGFGIVGADIQNAKLPAVALDQTSSHTGSVFTGTATTGPQAPTGQREAMDSTSAPFIPISPQRDAPGIRITTAAERHAEIPGLSSSARREGAELNFETAAQQQTSSGAQFTAEFTAGSSRGRPAPKSPGPQTGPTGAPGAYSSGTGTNGGASSGTGIPTGTAPGSSTPRASMPSASKTRETPSYSYVETPYSEATFHFPLHGPSSNDFLPSLARLLGKGYANSGTRQITRDDGKAYRQAQELELQIEGGTPAEQERVANNIKSWLKEFDTIRPLLARKAPSLSVAEAEIVNNLSAKYPKEIWTHRLVKKLDDTPSSGVSESDVNNKLATIDTFKRRRKEWQNNYHKRLTPSCLRPEHELSPEERLLIKENPSVAATFRAEQQAKVTPAGAKATSDRATQAETYWEGRKTTIPLSYTPTRRDDLLRYMDFWKDYETRGATNLGDDLQKAKDLCNKPFEQTPKTLNIPASATEEFKAQLPVFARYDGDQIGSALFVRNAVQIHAACSNAKEFFSSKTKFSRFDYAADSPSIVLLQANLAQQASTHFNSVAATYATKANESFNTWTKDYCSTIYDSFVGPGTVIGTFFTWGCERGRAVRFGNNFPQNLAHYEKLYEAETHLSNFLYHSALADETIKQRILSQESWIKGLTLTQTNTGFVAVDFVQKTCGATVRQATMTAVKKHCDREDYFTGFCEPTSTHPYNLHGTKPIAYMYSEGLKHALEMIKMYEADKKAADGAQPIPPMPGPQPVPPAPQPTTQPTPATHRPPPIIIVPVVVPDPAYAHIPHTGAPTHAPFVPQQHFTPPPPRATPAGQQGKRQPQGAKKRTTRSDSPIIDDAPEEPPAAAPAPSPKEFYEGDEEDLNDGYVVEPSAATKRARVQPTAQRNKAPEIIMADDDEDMEPGKVGPSSSSAAPTRTMPAHSVRGNNFSHVQELYVAFGDSAQIVSDRLAEADRLDEAARFSTLADNLQEVTAAAGEIFRGARGLGRGTAEGFAGSAQHFGREAATFGREYMMDPDAAVGDLAERLVHAVHNTANTIADFLLNEVPYPFTESYDARYARMQQRGQELLSRWQGLSVEQRGEAIGNEIGKILFAEVLMRGIGAGFASPAAARAARADGAAVNGFARSFREGIREEQTFARAATEGIGRAAEHATPLTRVVEEVEEILASGGRAGESATGATTGAAARNVPMPKARTRRNTARPATTAQPTPSTTGGPTPGKPPVYTGRTTRGMEAKAKAADTGAAAPKPSSMPTRKSPRTQATKPTATGGATAAEAAKSVPLIERLRPVGADFLDKMEAAGGHTLQKHVGQTPQELLRRCKISARETSKGPKITGATSFTNKQTANTAVLQNIRNNANFIEAWIASPVDQKKLHTAFDFSHDFPIGFGVEEKSKTVIYDLATSRVTITRDPSNALGFRVVSAFPVT